MKPQTEHAWAVCSDWCLIPYLCNRTRSQAIDAFMDFVGEPRSRWRKYKRHGWRCSRVRISEMTFGKEAKS